MPDHVTHSALAVASRRRILDALRASPAPLDVRTLAETTGLHENTVRFHLGVLIDTGYAQSRVGRRPGPGRPQHLYAATTPPVGDGGYHLLAEVLAGHLDEVGGGRSAQQAGFEWLRRSGTPGTTGTREPDGAIEATESPGTTGATRATDVTGADRPVVRAADRAVALFTELGFDPLATPEGAGVRIQLRSCPFIDVARRHPDIVCGVHRGLLRGVTESAGAGAIIAELVPFARPDSCLARIHPAPIEE